MTSTQPSADRVRRMNEDLFGPRGGQVAIKTVSGDVYTGKLDGVWSSVNGPLAAIVEIDLGSRTIRRTVFVSATESVDVLSRTTDKP